MNENLTSFVREVGRGCLGGSWLLPEINSCAIRYICNYHQTQVSINDG